MSAPNDGGPAFPTQNDQAWFYGMTLRDYFAAKAMQALIELDEGHDLRHGLVAQEAYAMADTMLAIRGPAE